MKSTDIIRHRKLYEELTDRLEKMILDGELAPGDFLPSERELMERFGVGRPSVRQALFVLEKSGLVEVSSGERARVAEPQVNTLIEELSRSVRYFFTHPDGVRHFREVRQLFEGALARYAARNANEKDIEDLRETLERCAAVLGDPAAFHAAAESFHRRLAEITRNPVFVVVETAIAEWLAPGRQLAGGARDKVALEAHHRVFDAIVARDPDRAEAAMAEHLKERTHTIAEAVDAKNAHGRSDTEASS